MPLIDSHSVLAVPAVEQVSATELFPVIPQKPWGRKSLPGLAHAFTAVSTHMAS